ncbi:MAG TPA: ATP-dependent DNA helicase RecG [Candidatus Peregrinibacteria bacterium]|nr:ATP-dependent DNA helicase RecG [Candidatus Peregrinibacteria bacterium]
MLQNPLSKTLSTTKAKLERLDFLSLKTVQDLLEYFPRDYEDTSKIVSISHFSLQEKNTSRGFLSPVKTTRTRYGKQIQKAVFTDLEGGNIDCIWFNQPHLARLHGHEAEVIISGKIKYALGKMTFQAPTFERISQEQIHTSRIVPIYPETEGIGSKWLREKIKSIFGYIDYFEEFLPQEIFQKYDFLERQQAFREIHFPSNPELLEKARERIAFEELFLLQLEALKRKKAWQQEKSGFAIPMDTKLVKKFISNLSYQLTNAQKITLYEILKDIEKDTPMLRLLEGDVGSGKTVVATIALLNTIKAGYQCALMAPTEILTKQHYQTIFSLLKDQNLNIQFLSGSIKASEKKKICQNLKNGTIDLIIGTHALIQEDVQFAKLGLAIVDEQHRFGVEQRAKLIGKNKPHLLMMTATPIPRTLALTIYGDQDLSIIDEMPPGRQKIITKVVRPLKRNQANLFVADQVQKGRQVFVICPLIEESEKLEVKSVKEEYKNLTENIFPQFRIAYLHGKMKSEEKDQVMTDFRNKKFDILVSTSVVEVGIDIPNATIMMIEGAERFGLSQLHQFRGRVGRGEHQSYCFLFTSEEVSTSLRRLRAMENHSDGFQLAEIDLEIRGPGEVYGTRQSGLPDLKIAHLMDGKTIAKARKEAEELLEKDPELKKHSLLREKIGQNKEYLCA